jgi:carboxyl-terminal processing protease
MKNMFQKSIKIGFKIIIVAFAILGVSQVLAGFSETGEFALLGTVKQYVKTEFVNKNVEDTKMEYGAIKGLLSALGDPYTRFVEPKNFEEMKVRMKGEFFGIGIHIGMKQDQLTVIAPIAGTPADKAGLKAMDSIIKIDGKTTEGLSLEEAVTHIRGPQGTPVVLNIFRKGNKIPFDVSIKRDRIEIKAVDKVEVFRGNIGYIRLNTFESQKATDEVEKAIEDLNKKQVQGLVLDLRNNGGGLLRNAIQITGLFIARGDVVHTVNRDGKRDTESVYGKAKFTPPMVVLLNEGSASASEILAGAIKDNNRGRLIGMHSFGKASVQRVINLPDRSAVLLTISKYLTPNGTDISAKGITVNVESQIPTESIEIAKKPNWEYTYEWDTQLQTALNEVEKEIKPKK